MINNEYLQEFIGTTISNLEHIRANGTKKEHSFTINCTDLEDYNYIDIRQASKFKTIFEELAIVTGPTLYWIEILPGSINNQEIVKALQSYKESIGAKNTPALKSNINYNSNILYVGKVKGVFWGRLIQHLGYFKVDGTQGLQLFYWAKALGLCLKFNIIEFDTNMADTISIIEYAFAKKLEPLIGKHK